MLQFKFDPFPNLISKRLVLRRINYSDAQDIFKIRSDEDIMKYIPRPVAKKLDDILEVIDKMDEGINTNEGINWGITLKDENICIGIIGFYRTKKEHFRSEVGYMLHSDHHGKGIMDEALKTVLEYGFTIMKLHSVEAVIDPDNKASAKLLEKNSFIKEAHFKENEFYNGKFLDTVIYSILNPFK